MIKKLITIFLLNLMTIQLQASNIENATMHSQAFQAEYTFFAEKIYEHVQSYHITMLFLQQLTNAQKNHHVKKYLKMHQSIVEQLYNHKLEALNAYVNDDIDNYEKNESDLRYLLKNSQAMLDYWQSIQPKRIKKRLALCDKSFNAKRDTFLANTDNISEAKNTFLLQFRQALQTI